MRLPRPGALLAGPLLAAALLPTATAAASTARPDGLPARVEALQPRVEDLRPRVEDLVTRDGGGTSIVLGADVLFAFGSADLPPDAAERLAGVVAAVRAGGAAAGSVRVEGHTDGIGQPADNQLLSERRAAAVEAALRAALGPGAPATTSAGFGEDRPLVPEVAAGKDDPAARARNRRVEVAVRP